MFARVLLLSSLIVSTLQAAQAGADGVRVAVLGYHDFSDDQAETEMRISTKKFRRQMEALRDLGLNVISMPDFEAWKRGEKEIPDKSIVITIDDGWKSTYTEAFPILKEFGFPFTLFLYQNYVDGGGRALTTPMLEEMRKHGGTIGSHSVSHPYPAEVKKNRKEGPDAYDEFLRSQMGESKRFLESKFGDAVTTYAYPGGFNTEEMFRLADEFGYQHLFTVLPKKVRRDSPNHTLPRYIILGTHDSIFNLATQFNDVPGSNASDSSSISQSTPFPVEPEAGSMTEERLPLISADLSEAGPIDPASVVMKVAGFGEVPAVFDAESSKVSWKVNRRLRGSRCQVQLNWKDEAGKAAEVPLRWTFLIDQEAAYVPRN